MIAPDSQSFPYLALAQRLGWPYRLVLAYAGAIEATWDGSRGYTVWESRAVAEARAWDMHVRPTGRERVAALVKREHARRQAAAGVPSP